MATATIKMDDGTTQTFSLAAKTFKTGSRGFHAQGKIVAEDGKKFQANLLLVEVGSKPSA